MSTTSKSPRKVLVAAWRVAQKSLPLYSHKCSPKTFTLHQLFAGLVLKAFLGTDYRGLAATLQDSEQWCRDIELKKVPRQRSNLLVPPPRSDAHGTNTQHHDSLSWKGFLQSTPDPSDPPCPPSLALKNHGKRLK